MIAQMAKFMQKRHFLQKRFLRIGYSGKRESVNFFVLSPFNLLSF